MPDAPAIDVQGLRKSYGDFEAVKGIDLRVEPGQVFALLGPNGAGKTTTVEILEGYRERTGGDVAVLGEDPAKQSRALKAKLGIVLQSTGVDLYLTVAETIELYRGYYPSPRPLDEVIELVGLQEKRDTKVSKLSGGQQRRLDVAVALAGDPQLLFLDEPTTGFDPNARRNAWDIVKNLASLGKTVFLTTHYMDEAQYLADEVAVIAAGKIVSRGTPDTIGGRDTAMAIVRFTPPAGLPESLRSQVASDGDAMVYRAEDPTKFLNGLTGWSLESRVAIEGLTVSRPSLEDVYLELTKDQPGLGEDATAERYRQDGQEPLLCHRATQMLIHRVESSEQLAEISEQLRRLQLSWRLPH
jgi:ABC-2 type transport system ATP-binding protein